MLAALGFLMVLVTATPVLRYWTHALSAKWGPDDGDTLVLLGGGTIAADMLDLSSYWRAFNAIVVWRHAHFKRIVIAGRDTAVPMRALLINQGIPVDAIVVEDQSNSTRENALFVAKMLDRQTGKIVLVSSDFHTGRAERAFQHAGLTVTSLPYPDAGKRINDWRERWSVFRVLLEETVKVVYYRVKGWG